MTLPALVLVHGGLHAADCWDLTIDEIHRLAPDLTVLAVDLPGRRGKPGDLRTLTVGDCVDSVLTDVEDAGLDEVIVCGHSMGGVTVPGVVAKLGLPRVREMVLAAAFVPPQGMSVVGSLGGHMGWYARRVAGTREVFAMPPIVSRLAFCNGMTSAQREFALSRIYRESVSLATEKVYRSDLPGDLRWSWILTRRDRSLSARQQRRIMATLPGMGTVIPIDTCHNLMVSEPQRVAEILVERCRRYAR